MRGVSELVIYVSGDFIGIMGPKKVSKRDLSKPLFSLTRSNAELELEERVGEEKEMADYSNLNVMQLREIIRERGMASPKARTR